MRAHLLNFRLLRIFDPQRYKQLPFKLSTLFDSPTFKRFRVKSHYGLDVSL